MEAALVACLLLVTFLFVLNGLLNGRLKDRVDAVLCIVWLCILAITLYWFGWKGVGVALILTFIAAVIFYPLARMAASFLYSRAPKGRNSN